MSNDKNLKDLEKELDTLLRDLQEAFDNSNDQIIDGVDMEELEKAMETDHRVKLKYKKIHPDAVSPVYNYETDSGFDLHSVEEIILGPFERALVPTGLTFDIPEGTEIQVRTKSGLAIKQGLMVLNSPGTVDQGYTGEVKVIIMNMNNVEVTVLKGQKVAQGVVCPVYSGKWVNVIETQEINEKDRSSNGFGSTGI
jgi:dUTP pyrophosphatase